MADMPQVHESILRTMQELRRQYPRLKLGKLHRKKTASPETGRVSHKRNSIPSPRSHPHRRWQALRQLARALQRRLHGDDLPAYYEILYAHVQSIQGEYLETCKTADSGIPESVETHGLVVYLSALSSKTLALLHLGRWGELRRVAQTAISMAAKNGNEPWEGIFRAILAWLSLEATGWEGAQRAASGLLESFRDEPPGQVRSMANQEKIE